MLQIQTRQRTRAAERGYAEAQYRLAQMLEIGQGIREDDTEAAAAVPRPVDRPALALLDAQITGLEERCAVLRDNLNRKCDRKSVPR